ncbi:hypothetical protein BXZ70DRAFT_1007108 [Cristinia sonorae]|uniref:Uncharacterized protein n=1 Tax=Cristinia sonorae TaxID=1940300 RepID=A0A8K0URZ1_9AGAR|nr:hypothetical protein BXZ70DRAFT_1007108 [Cristinia sonorae]
MPKRSRETFDETAVATPGPPAKRLQTDLLGSSPFSSRTSTTSTPRTPFSIPSDSPSNPFGLKKSLVALDLPPPISFGKHVVLRFQFVEEQLPMTTLTPRRGPRKPATVFRIVQVPTSYTFRHLHKLIFYLFASDVERHHSVRPPTPRAAKGKAKAVSRALSLAKVPSSGKRRIPAGPALQLVASSLSRPDAWRGHVFEVYRGDKEHRLVSGEEETNGIVIPRNGRLWRKLSSVRERHIFRDLYDAAETSSKLDDGADSDEEEDWAWEAEDDFELAKLWPKGPSLRRAIIYRHNPHISIHIANHQGTVPYRKGIGNLPFVFQSQGTAGDTIKISHDIQNQGKMKVDEADDELPLLPSSLPTPAAQINRWNAHGTFARFLKCEDERERRLRGLTPYFSERNGAHSDGVVPSSPVNDIPFPNSDADSDSDFSVYSDSVLFPFASSAVTPFPAHPAHRKRVQSAERRLERLMRDGLSKSHLSDEEDERERKKKEAEKVSVTVKVEQEEGDHYGLRAESVEIPEGVTIGGEGGSPDSDDDWNPFAEWVDDEIEI